MPVVVVLVVLAEVQFRQYQITEKIEVKNNFAIQSRKPKLLLFKALNMPFTFCHQDVQLERQQQLTSNGIRTFEATEGTEHGKDEQLHRNK